MSLRLRLTLLYTGLLTGALILFSLLAYGILRWTYIQAVDTNLEQVGLFVAQSIRQAGGRVYIPALQSLSDRSTFILVRNLEEVVARSSDFTGSFPLHEQARKGQAMTSSEVDAQGLPYRLYTLPLTVGDEVRGWVQVAQPLHLMELASARMRPLLGLGVFLFVGATGVAAWWLAGRAIRPIQNVAQAAEAIGHSADLSLRVPMQGPEDEVGRLVLTFNDMLEQLQGLYGRLAATLDAQKRFVADASHELRTPLTIIRGNIEYLEKAQTLDPEALADVKAEAERMSRLVEELLAMARADAGQEPELEPLALGPLVREVCRRAEALPHEAAFRTDLPEALDRVMITGHAEWLRRALLILIDNAFKYTPSGSVTVRAGRQGEGVVLQVIDTGIGIPAEDLPHIFERFYRADRARARGGTGLGLAIANWVAGIHNGALTVESELGKGSTFSLWLPIRRSA
ncbi:MAG: sensor histidine kinase [Bacillota bacterium]